ncbi:MAG: class I SAM-dependent methyltransferase [Spirochaetia bacterium]|nr:class I SAM-dependent methyltransferase [Spirochaetia bacterium]
MKIKTYGLLLFILASTGLFSDEKADQDLDVPYEPSHPKVVEAMLNAGQVTAKDVLYDLGCGDGRIVIAAAKKGATAIGADVDEERLIEARELAKAAGVEGRTKFLREDIFKTDISPATIVTMYLLDEVNLQMRS